MPRLTLLCFVLFASAAIGAYEFESAQMEADYLKLTNELRCLVCQNQNLAGSNADLAKDLRQQTYEMLMQGKSPDQIVEYMVARYGDFVSYRPQLKRNTILLWIGPFALLALVSVLVIRAIRKKQKLRPPDAESMKRAQQLLANSEGKP
ncbi:MAG: cytochrome c-type biogenesis protein CcmH [Proteobacteria bacterium]|nr:cytochrome c-type biogenesis protein CcmH [Pseudomonadota bacterium]